MLHVPGLRESSLRIEIGDVVNLRQLHLDFGGQVIPHADCQHNSVVWGIDRRNEGLALRIDGIFHRTMRFNVSFTLQIQHLDAAEQAVETTQRALIAGTGDAWMRSMLFPESSDGVLQHTLNKRLIDLQFYDELLNYEQQKAVNTVLREMYGPVPFIISGCPGVGKTKTLVELALQLVKNPSVHLLLCAPSDSAADSIVQRLSATRAPLLRVNSPARAFPEVSNRVLPYTHSEDGVFTLPPHEKLLQYQIVITTCRDADILVRACVTNRDLFHLETRMHSILHPNEPPLKPRLHWTGLLVDEAAQATEPEVLTPLNVVAPPNQGEFDGRDPPIFVLVGDAKQLGPRSASKSLFERLLDRPLYRDHQLARSKANGGIMPQLTKSMLPIVRPPFINLIHNYRSHPAILAVPSALFYNDTLEPEAADTESLLSWSGWQGRGWPVLFALNTAPDEIESEGGGWYNNSEALMALRYAHSFVEAGLLQQREICIMSPFAAQVKVLRQIARKNMAMPALNIGPLEAFQGLESRLVIICTTRTRNRFIDQDIAKGLGVMYEPKRFNVALTRAMQGLIVIGNPAVLGFDPNWKAFLAFCGRNELHEELPEGVQLPASESGLGESRLERRMVLQEEAFHPPSNGMRRLGFAEDAEESLWRSGNDAEAVVRHEEYESED